MTGPGNVEKYTPSDRLYLWYLAEPEKPVPVAELNLLRSTQGVSVRDDHEKNHSLVVNEAQQYSLSPAYDIVPSGQALGFQQMRVGQDEGDSTLANAFSMSRMFLLDRDEAVEEVRTVARVVARWKEHFKSLGVTDSDIDLYTEQIDRPFLRDQREEFAGASS